MSRRTLSIVCLALVCGVSAAIMINALVNATQGPDPDVVQVVVAKGEIARYTLLTADMLTTRPCAKEHVPAGAIFRVMDAVERMTRQNLGKNEDIVDGRLYDKNSGKGMANDIPMGMRACTILTPTVSNSVAGFIRPGNRVDVLLTVASGVTDASGGGRNSTLLQDVEIWAIDQFLDQPVTTTKQENRELRSVTLLVTPQQTLNLNLGQNSGKLHLILRNPEDSLAANTQPVTLRQLQGEKEKVEVKVVPPPKESDLNDLLGTIRTMRGSAESKIVVTLPPPSPRVVQAAGPDPE